MSAARSQTSRTEAAQIPDATPASLERAGARHAWAMGAIFALGALLRLTLTWANPPYNAWDDHFEPMLLLLTQGTIPPKFACFQCYHPPVFYVTSAALAWIVTAFGGGGETGLKLLQLLNYAFGVGALVVTLAIVERIPVPRPARLAAALVIAVLPRHIYVSAAHGNDGLAVLLVAVVIWLLLTFGDGRRSALRYAALGAAASLAIFTKYNALIVLPGIAVALASLPALRDPGWRRPAIGRALLALGVPALLLAAAMAGNIRDYGTPLPGNHEFARRNPGVPDFVAMQPRDRTGVDFLAFSPSAFVSSPLLRPGQLNEFWTLMQAGMWFDTDARFVQLIATTEWANRYYAWLRGDAPFVEGDPGPHARFAVQLGAPLGLVGLVILAIGAAGAAALVRTLRRDPGSDVSVRAVLRAMVVLAAFNVAGVAYWAAQVPVYSAIKSAFLLPSLPVMGALLALGFAAASRRRPTWFAAVFAAGLLAALVTTHILHLAASPQ